jgi:murein DD-endopeptidase MepM/ murein hydrolase activator NlpD
VPRPTQQHALARRAQNDDQQGGKRRWLHHGIAALAVSVLGLGVAGSAMLTGSAQQRSADASAVQTVVQPGVAQPAGFDSRAEQVSRSTKRPALSGTAARVVGTVSNSDHDDAVEARAKKLAATSAASRKNAARIKAARKAKLKEARKSGDRIGSSGGSVLPLAGGYTVAARFGQVGSWSRYHTGFDFAAPVGAAIFAPTSGVVTNAGGGDASGWAGNYVTIRHPDGTTSLFAHMGTVSVTVGQSVSGGDLLGAVGMTGRTFGPHLHFEVYPAGATPGDVYTAVNPEPWLASLGLVA